MTGDRERCLTADAVTTFERTCQPGSWVEIKGSNGKVRSVGLWAVRLVAPDTTEVIVPHSALWASPVFNATAATT